MPISKAAQTTMWTSKEYSELHLNRVLGDSRLLLAKAHRSHEHKYLFCRRNNARFMGCRERQRSQASLPIGHSLKNSQSLRYGWPHMSASRGRGASTTCSVMVSPTETSLKADRLRTSSKLSTSSSQLRLQPQRSRVPKLERHWAGQLASKNDAALVFVHTDASQLGVLSAVT